MTYQCKICKLAYSDEKIAEQCQAWCSSHDSCNYLIAKQAVNKGQVRDLPVEDDERFKDKKD